MFVMGLTPLETIAIWAVFGVALLGLAYAVFLRSQILREDNGTPQMQEVWNAIKDGADAYLKKQFRSILPLIGILTVALFFSVYIVPPSPEALERFEGVAPATVRLWIGFARALAFVMGALFSLTVGQLGMRMAVEANVRVASASKRSFGDALRIAYRAGTITGMLTDGLGLLGGTIIFMILGIAAPDALLGFGFGGTLLALFMRVGGGIFTKAADVGADLVGKVEAGIPEDDPRNPAVIADLVGDNVGDCAGRGADLFESTAAENVGAMILGIALFPIFGMGGILFPLLARAFGLIATIVGVYTVKCREDEDPMNGLNRGYLETTVLAMAGFAASVYLLLKPTADQPVNQLYLLGAGVIGILTAYAFVWITQYYTEYKYRPVREIAEASLTGPATNIISGISVGLECVLAPVLVISAAIIGSYLLGDAAIEGGGLFGTAVATMGMLGTAAYILAMDTFGPITDNAGGIVEMSHQPDEIRKRTDRLDAVGNTTKALTKGYAIGSAALAAFLLFTAYLEEVKNFRGGVPLSSINIAEPKFFIAGLLGATLVFYFSSLAIKAVGKSAFAVIEAVRKQFREH